MSFDTDPSFDLLPATAMQPAWPNRKIIQRPPNTALKMPPDILSVFGGDTNSEAVALLAFSAGTRRTAMTYNATRPGAYEDSPSNFDLGTYVKQMICSRKEVCYGIQCWIRNSVSYRNSLQALATRYVDFLGIRGGMGPCELWDVDIWERNHERDETLVIRWKTAGERVWKSGLLPHPDEGEGHDFVKPEKYVAACMAMMDWDRPQVEQGIAELFIAFDKRGGENVGFFNDPELDDYNVVEYDEVEDEMEDEVEDVRGREEKDWKENIKNCVWALAKNLTGPST